MSRLEVTKPSFVVPCPSKDIKEFYQLLKEDGKPVDSFDFTSSYLYSKFNVKDKEFVEVDAFYFSAKLEADKIVLTGFARERASMKYVEHVAVFSAAVLFPANLP
jgi:hypothetical protein